MARCTPSPRALRYSGEVPWRSEMRTSGMANPPCNSMLCHLHRAQARRSSAFAEFVTGEIAQAVVRGILVGFAKGGIVEDLLDELVDGQPIVQDHHADVN